MIIGIETIGMKETGGVSDMRETSSAHEDDPICAGASMSRNKFATVLLWDFRAFKSWLFDKGRILTALFFIQPNIQVSRLDGSWL
jgi:hypothetical protein